jgi:multidrug efflux pump subunit AcrB
MRNAAVVLYWRRIISIRVFGDKPDTLRKLSYSVEQIVKSNPGTIYTNNELNVLKIDIKIDVNREKTRTPGVLTADIAKTVRMAVAGLQLGTFTDEKPDDYKVMVDVSKTRMPTLDVFANLVAASVLTI